MRGETNQCAISPHLKRGFDATESMTATARNRMTAAAIHRP
jgi:hypothetical protein